MKRLLAALFVLCVPGWARAQAPAWRPHFALGVSNAFELRRDYGDALRVMYAPELLGQGYLALGGSYHLRPGLRVGYDGIKQAEQPRDARVVERGFHVLAESALLYDWIVVPAFTLGVGTSSRFIRAETRHAVHGGAALDRNETLLMLMAQLGLGIPLVGGRLLVEPYARFQAVLSDRRAWTRLGFDFTVGF